MNQSKKSYQIQGMTCSTCAIRLQKVLAKKGIDGTVNFANETLTINDDSDFAALEELVKKAGFGLSESKSGERPVSFFGAFWQRYWLLILVSVPFFVNMIFMVVGKHILPIAVQFILASVVQFWVAIPFYKKAYSGLKNRLANMDVLVSLGTLCIYTYSAVMFFRGLHEVYFEAGVMIVFFISLGKFIESFVKKDSADSTALLLSLVPTYVELKTESGYQSTLVTKVKIGSQLRVKTYETIALDGVVVTGEGLCDESHLTGESTPIQKKAGDKLMSGAVVLSGSFVYKTTSDSRTSELANLADNLALAQNSRANITRLSDKVASVFVPAVVGLSILTFLVNYAILGQFESSLLRAVAVLVIACPCALGLAAPLAIMAGMGVAARHGVWFKDAVSLERAGSIDVVVFDKTGTLTAGRPSLTNKVLLDGKANGCELLAMAASLEELSNHPLAYAIVSAAKQDNLPSYNTKNVKISNDGIVGEVEVEGVWRLVHIGKASFVGFPISAIPNDKDWQMSSVVTMSVDNVPTLAMALSDAISDDGREVIEKLRLDTKLIIMSGDRMGSVEFVANRLGLDDYCGEMTPDDKANRIKALQADGLKVCMIGDGINDVLAMTVADSSFAVFNATDVAKNSSSARLLGGSLLGAWYGKRIAQKTLANIRQNLFFAFVYNVAGIGFAAIGLLTPVWAAIFMSLSSLSVVANSYRLKFLTIK